MNVRIRNKEDAFFIIGAILITPLICFYQDVRAGKKEKKDFDIILILDSIILMCFAIFLILLYIFKLPLIG